MKKKTKEIQEEGLRELPKVGEREFSGKEHKKGFGEEKIRYLKGEMLGWLCLAWACYGP